jgi:hypothetical protein
MDGRHEQILTRARTEYAIPPATDKGLVGTALGIAIIVDRNPRPLKGCGRGSNGKRKDRASCTTRSVPMAQAPFRVVSRFPAPRRAYTGPHFAE